MNTIEVQTDPIKEEEKEPSIHEKEPSIIEESDNEPIEKPNLWRRSALIIQRWWRKLIG